MLPVSLTDWGYLLVLSLLCTTLAYVLALRALNHLTAFASNLTVNLEPVYGILLAWILLRENEELTPVFTWAVRSFCWRSLVTRLSGAGAEREAWRLSFWGPAE